MNTSDLYTMHKLHVIAVLVLIVITAIVGIIGIAVWPKVLIWREKLAIRRQHRKGDLIDRLERARAAQRYGITPTFRRNSPLHCIGCGASFDNLTDAVVHQCPSERVS